MKDRLSIAQSKMDNNIHRGTLLIILAFLWLFVLTGQLLFLAVSTIDYTFRIFVNPGWSPLHIIARRIVRLFNIQPEWVTKRSGLLAEILALGFCISALFFFIWEFELTSILLVSVLILLTVFELVLNFCAVCWLSDYVQQPQMNKIKK